MTFSQKCWHQLGISTFFVLEFNPHFKQTCKFCILCLLLKFTFFSFLCCFSHGISTQKDIVHKNTHVFPLILEEDFVVLFDQNVRDLLCVVKILFRRFVLVSDSIAVDKWKILKKSLSISNCHLVLYCKGQWIWFKSKLQICQRLLLPVATCSYTHFKKVSSTEDVQLNSLTILKTCVVTRLDPAWIFFVRICYAIMFSKLLLNEESGTE